MLAQGFLRVKGQAEITKCYFVWVGAINVQSIDPLSRVYVQSLSGNYLMRQQVLMVFSLLVYLGTVAYTFVEISLGSCVITSFNLSKCCYLHFWRKKFASMLAQGYFKG